MNSEQREGKGVVLGVDDPCANKRAVQYSRFHKLRDVAIYSTLVELVRKVISKAAQGTR